ncbi:hypothetical protein BH24ACI3_BH24ACI3_06300 [soil metagenome]
MKKIDMSEKAIEQRLRQVDQLHALSLELLRSGMKHYEKLIEEGKASKKELARYKKYFASITANSIDAKG